ncbi:MAG: HAD family hydrolase [Eubacteriales bacterium]|nr:HAD family hydrolase [Eubacteriales bacterium]
MIERRALFFDVDGTLMGENGTIPKSALTAIKEARDNGDLVFINSGRVYPLAAYLDKYIETDGLLCGCGTDLRLGNEQLYVYYIPENIMEDIRSCYMNYNIDIFLEGPQGISPSPNLRIEESLNVAEFIKAQNGMTFMDFDDKAYRPSKFCVLSDEESDIDGFKERFQDIFDFIDRGDGFYECVPHGHGKGFAVFKILELCNIKPENTYVFGDSTNDIDMLKVVDHAIIMGEHDKAIEEYAEFVTRNVEDDGIAYAMKHYGIIK